ncbi:cellular apoptosis susceptibility protein [Thecamonas trahens ATCC 50062]|uniref:Cellular apoptosis susceptibility protein n=1 Tax=Thecamonas trahens ATCC 50062 TaxID=461836 RepID=A0A0L0DU11_THETB|nr:cellular apoptosis susceptibility protein [Thecamonas trahens ATCC 50062]KNC55536.1 cellular apoptosis susceptibility protein [Thecamonas trahens ATCC 50062]|eukprot:XP_013761310.1 cellular apoptosis susceptibility protein [Thecamonas trahens ATCC 50062]
MALVVTEPAILVAQAMIFTTVAVHVLHGDNGGLPTAAAAKETLGHVAGVLQASFSGNDQERKAAEAAFADLKTAAGFAPVLLKLVEGAEGAIGMSAALQLKNYVMRHWKNGVGSGGLDDDDIVIDEADKAVVREALLGVLVAQPTAVQDALQDVVYAIALVDYHERWDSLMPELVARLQHEMGAGDFDNINSLLGVVARVFKKYEGQFASDALMLELLYSLKQFQEPLLSMFSAASEAAVGSSDNPGFQAQLFHAMSTMAGIFYSLSVHDLPEYMEDHLEPWMQLYSQWLSYEVENPPSALTELHAQIISICALYTEIASEEFNDDYLPTFVELIWKRLMRTSQDPSEDELFARGVQFLTSLASRATHGALFQDPEALQAICEQVILPNVRFTAADMQTFELDPVQYIAQILKGGDVDTRRHAASQLIAGLCDQYREPVTQIFSTYVGQLLESYTADPSPSGEGWIAKDAAMFLVSKMTVVRSSTKLGTTEVSEFVNIGEFFSDHVVPELVDGDVNSKPVLKTDALLFCATFRNQLPPDALHAIVAPATALLTSESFVVRTVAAHALSTILVASVTNESGERLRVFGPDVVTGDVLEKLLVNLFGAMDAGSDRSERENAFVMKAIMRVASCAGAGIVPYVGTCVDRLTGRIGEACANPGDPSYNHYMFEALAAIIKAVCSSESTAVAAFEDMLFEPFTAVLQAGIEEFSPYVFQILASMLEIRTAAGGAAADVPEGYTSLIQPLMTPALWAVTSNMPAMVRLLQALVRAAPDAVIAANVVEPVLGIFRKLLGRRANFPHAFSLLHTVTTGLPAEALASSFHNIYILIFTKLTATEKSPWYVRHMGLWMTKYAAVMDTWDGVMAGVEALQSGLFGQLVPILADAAARYADPVERKAVVVSLTKLLTGTPAFAQNFGEAWSALFAGIVDALALELKSDDESLEVKVAAAKASSKQVMHSGSSAAEASALEYDTKFAQLANAQQAVEDIAPEVENPRAWFVEQVVGFSRAVGGGILANVELSQEQGEAAMEWFAAAGVDTSAL